MERISEKCGCLLIENGYTHPDYKSHPELLQLVHAPTGYIICFWLSSLELLRKQAQSIMDALPDLDKADMTTIRAFGYRFRKVLEALE